MTKAKLIGFEKWPISCHNKQFCILLYNVKLSNPTKKTQEQQRVLKRMWDSRRILLHKHKSIEDCVTHPISNTQHPTPRDQIIQSLTSSVVVS
jgi:hypothetical protein